MDDTKKGSILLTYFTNVDDNVYALRPALPPQVGAAVISRCSRTSKPLRELFWEEFLKNPDLSLSSSESFSNGVIGDTDAEKRAGEFFNRVLAQYGDESVGEMATVSVIVENVSPIALKVIESMRRMAFIEVSTRYVDFRTKINGQYRYYADKDLEQIMGREYHAMVDRLFDKYVEWFEPVHAFVQKSNPMLESEKEAAYNGAVHARTCDILREMLPFGITANAGICGNGRDWSDLVNIMRAHPLEEVRTLGTKIMHEVAKIIPNIMQRSIGSHGDSAVEYLAQIRSTLHQERDRIHEVVRPTSSQSTLDSAVQIKQISSLPFERICTTAMYEALGEDFDTLLEYYKLNPARAEQCITLLQSLRQNRFNKPIDAYESVKLSVEMTGPLSAWKDLQRHRRLSQWRSPYALNKGFYVAPELVQMGLDKEYCNIMQSTLDFIAKVKSEHPELAYQIEYLVPHGTNIKWIMDMDLAEAIYMIELRSSSGGHMTYRKLMHLFYRELEKIDPRLAKLSTNVDLDEYYLGRRQSFNKVIEKGGTLN